ncbi:MAG TPA: hypothetical protein VLF66_11640 [Thermoanaerobaculia bacterium]|nr:hypothetical protein [Thermoanaerobaculia bacterium]
MPEPGVEGLREAWFRPMGYSLRLVTDSEAVLEAARVSFRGFGEEAPCPEPDLDFRLVGDPDGRRAGEEPAEPVLWFDRPRARQTAADGSELVLDGATGRARGRFSGATLAHTAFFRWHYLDLALFFMLEARGFVGVHGAAVARDGRALLLRAPCGQGKTVLTYAAARRGFQALAEDVVWLAPGDGPWWGAPWAFRLLPDARDLFPELDGYRPTVQINGEEKIEVDLEALRPGSTVVSAEPGPVVMVRRAPGEASRIEPLAPGEAETAWRAGAASRESGIAGYEAAVAPLLRRGVFRLRFGDDIDRAVELLAELADGTAP